LQHDSNFYLQAINLSTLLNFDPSTLDIGLHQEQERTPSTPKTTSADVKECLEKMAKLLDDSVMQLVKDSEILHAMLEPVIDQLRADLK